MLGAGKPTSEQLEHFLQGQRQQTFSYPEVGATRGQLPGGYWIDRHRVCLGRGREVFDCARAALESWQQYPTGWLRRYPDHIPVEPGETVIVSARAFGLWATVACRIVYVIDSPGETTRFGFAYGTLPGHAERGEERFLIEWNQADDDVWYEVLAFSRPSPLWARLSVPAIRVVQKKFFAESLRAMENAVDRSVAHV